MAQVLEDERGRRGEVLHVHGADRAKGAAEEERKCCIYLRNQGSAGLAYAISDSRATSRTHRIGVLTDRFIFARTTINLRDERAPKSIADACAASSLVLTPILSHTCCLFPPSLRVSPSRLSRIIISLSSLFYSLLRIPARYDRTSRVYPILPLTLLILPPGEL